MKNKEFLTVSEVAKLLGISREAILKRIKKGQLKATRIGRNFAIPKKEFESISGKALTEKQKSILDKGIKKTISEYKTTLKLLGQE
jgi:excisionase family DNA binding protein